jgi:hypothetical protein
MGIIQVQLRIQQMLLRRLSLWEIRINRWVIIIVVMIKRWEIRITIIRTMVEEVEIIILTIIIISNIVTIIIIKKWKY